MQRRAVNVKFDGCGHFRGSALTSRASRRERTIVLHAGECAHKTTAHWDAPPVKLERSSASPLNIRFGVRRHHKDLFEWVAGVHAMMEIRSTVLVCVLAALACVHAQEHRFAEGTRAR